MENLFLHGITHEHNFIYFRTDAQMCQLHLSHSFVQNLVLFFFYPFLRKKFNGPGVLRMGLGIRLTEL